MLTIIPLHDIRQRPEAVKDIGTNLDHQTKLLFEEVDEKNHDF